MKKLILLLFLSIYVMVSRADEGMWLLSRLKQYNEARMKELGLKVPVDVIVDSLSQAIISFNGNGTASFISKDGLLVTNYHCAYAGIQQSSSDENNYIRDGFWASRREDEIPLSGINISINRVIKDVSDEVNAKLIGVKADRKVISEILSGIVAGYRKQYPGMQVNIRSYRNNSLHVLYVAQSFSDVRLVGAPPYAIAKFGGETDNWTWPRHGCDFAYLRVYVSKDGKSTGYHADNVPYHPDVYLKVSTEGYKKGDYAMSIGYPGYTNRNATSMQIWETQHVLNPPMIKIRTARQEILQKFMREDESLRIKYAEKFASSANYCKNSIGMNQWIEDLKVCEKKAEYELAFLNSCKNDSVRQYYESVLRDIDKGIKDAARYRTAMGYYVEALGEGCEMLRFVSSFGKAIPHAQRDKGEMRANLLVNVKMYYKDYSEKVDCTVMKALLKIVRDDLDADLLPEFFETLKNEYRGDVDKFVDDLYEHSVFANQERLLAALDNPSLNIKEDVVYKMSEQLEKKRRELFRLVDGKRAVAQRAILEYNKGILNFDQQNYYPNADKTIRLSYGTICDLPLENGDVKPFQTCLSGVIRKAKSDNPDFYLPDKLKKLWESKDFGRYNQNGDVPADFIMNGDVTGGNSGSPLLNAKGELIGLVFDCNWESMTRDFNFDQKLHRVICLDVRYLLFITEKYAHAENVINEILKD
ncbi:S46 family peptidase [Butyricimonas paravirosa]|uniref:S46 family peptidase n=1 Tax=Butyricimonas paravirosa TaxID=1472417 RepID=UPI00210DCA16|nr:S46 family peptidase [Butyricimonas paravirosa]MCQ4875590.1 S46 family peptidase [Butyricimonas paravirosa]